MSITQFIHSCFYYYGPSFPPRKFDYTERNSVCGGEGGRAASTGRRRGRALRCVRAMQQWTWVIALSLSLLLPPSCLFTLRKWGEWIEGLGWIYVEAGFYINIGKKWEQCKKMFTTVYFETFVCKTVAAVRNATFCLLGTLDAFAGNISKSFND